MKNKKTARYTFKVDSFLLLYTEVKILHVVLLWHSNDVAVYVEMPDNISAIHAGSAKQCLYTVKLNEEVPVNATFVGLVTQINEEKLLVYSEPGEGRAGKQEEPKASEPEPDVLDELYKDVKRAYDQYAEEASKILDRTIEKLRKHLKR